MDEGLIIDWTQMPTYNTIMSVAAGSALLSLLVMGWRLQRRQSVSFEGYAVTFGVLGAILTITGAHMTLTWPFAKYFPFDNIIFGEPSLGFGVLLLGAGAVLWRRSDRLRDSENAGAELVALVAPLGIFVIGLGLALIAIAIAGVTFQLFAAPPEEPISGAFAEWPWVEAIFMSGLFALVGVGAVLFPFAASRFAVRDRPSALEIVVGVTLGAGGLAFFVFGALNFFTHIGLIVNTMPS